MNRPTLDEYLMSLARTAAARTTCIRRGVGCVLADGKGRVMAVAYNGVASGLPHCNEGKVEGVDYVPWPPGKKGTNLTQPSRWINVYPYACPGHDLPPGQDHCEAVHAEQNALLQCPDPDRIRTAYVTLSPCLGCTKLLLNTGCGRLVVGEVHSVLDGLDLWVKAGKTWTLLRKAETGSPGLPLATPDGWGRD